MAASKEKIGTTGQKVYSKVVCIGAGFSGLGVACSLKRWYNVTDVVLYDRAASCAGTWTNNRYPGCACDVPGALYSLSYAQNPNWTRVLAYQPEVKAYLEGVADQYDLNSRIRCRTEVQSCTWNDKTKSWILSCRDAETDETWQHECQVVFACTGGLVDPRKLDVPGEERFKGPIFHTARWDDSVDLKDKKVAVVGNGCTGIQLVPALVNKVGVKSVKHFIRSQHWIFPGFDMPYPPFMRWGFRNIPGLLRLHRLQLYLITQRSWKGFYMTDKAAAFRQQRQAVTEGYMRKAAPEKYHDILIPKFEIGCKRRIFDTGYCRVLHNENVDLTNQPLAEITETGIKTRDGKHEEFDAILLANGFDLRTPMAAMKITGRDSVDLHEQWQKQGGAGAYSCIAVHGFPNFFFIAGPNTATGHTSVVIAAENTTNLALRVAKPLFDGSSATATVEASAQAEDCWNTDLQEASKHRVWTQGGCSSWYVGENKWVSTLYPYSQFDMWWRCMFPKWNDWIYKTRSGKSIRYRGLDRFLRPILFSMLLTALAGWLFFSRLGVKLPFLERILSR